NAESFAVKLGRIGVLDLAGFRRNRTGYANPDRGLLFQLFFRLEHKRGDLPDDRRIGAARRWFPVAVQLLAAIIKGDYFCLGAAQINADTHLQTSCPYSYKMIKALCQ